MQANLCIVNITNPYLKKVKLNMANYSKLPHEFCQYVLQITNDVVCTKKSLQLFLENDSPMLICYEHVAFMI